MEPLNDLIGEIYDAALDPALWPGTLQTMADALNACFAGFGWEDTRVMTVGGSYGNEAFASEDDYRRRYKKTLVYSNPMRVPVLLTQEVEDVFTPGMLVPAAEYHASRYYREYVKPMGWGDGLSTILSKHDGVVHFLAFARRAEDPPFGAGDIALLKLLSPHVRRAYTIGNLIGRQKAQIDALGQTFDGLTAAVFLLGARREVTYRNASASALLARGAPFVVRGERLVLANAAASAAFETAIEAASGSGAEASDSKASIVLPTPEGRNYVAHFLSLAPRDRREATQDGAAAALFVTEVGLDTRSPIEVIANAYGLTPREMNVVVAIVDDGGVNEVAARLGVSANTVRSHLKAIFQKTGVSRQADLVRLVASHLGPIGDRGADTPSS